MAVATKERTLTMAQAISEAIGQEMERDERVFVMGEDVGSYGGIFSATGGLEDARDEEIRTRARQRVSDAYDFARESALPDPAEALQHVFV